MGNLVKLYQVLIAVAISPNRQNVHPLREPDTNLDFEQMTLICTCHILTSGPDLVFLHLTKMQQRTQTMATKTRTTTTAAVFPPSSVGSEGSTSGPSCRGLGKMPVGTAVKEVSVIGGRQIFFWFFKVGERPLGQEQTVFPSFNVDLKVSGQAQMAVAGLGEENYIGNLVFLQCVKNCRTPIKHSTTPGYQADVGAT